jgi:hypothetical protein
MDRRTTRVTRATSHPAEGVINAPTADLEDRVGLVRPEGPRDVGPSTRMSLLPPRWRPQARRVHRE